METTFQFVRTTFRGALAVLVPILIVVLLGKHIYAAIRGVLLKMSGWLPDAVPLRGAVTLIAILIVCFLIGVFLRTRLGKNLIDWLETSVLDKVPFYSLIKTVTRQVTGMEDADGFTPVLAEMEGGFVVAFQVEELDNGFVSIFLPSSPSPTSGSVFLYPKSMVHPIQVSFFKTLRCVSKWGNGAGPLLTALGSTPDGAAVLDRIRTRQP
jgi:uncharacterized membrane protein